MSVRLTPRLCRAARALAGLEQKDLASVSGVSKSTIGAFEIKNESARLATMNNRALVEAFERSGLQFIPENGGGPGVRLREPIGSRRSKELSLDQIATTKDA
ncbi:XRE family transcriptional regulator [Microvirga vignae]|uniref:XRE family transcriptional regulator n=1 Tax=Microvirga vignae TaxID=1225564 RepID=UPI000A04C6ED|nr:XRE family transcriptional regulator [Microvirga vignae]